MYLPVGKQNMILNMLVEGMSIRSVSRLTNVDKNTILRLIEIAGKRCGSYLNKAMVKLPCKTMEIDEIWSFVHTKQDNLPYSEKRDVEFGDQYIYIALDANSKLIPTFLVGKRNEITTHQFIWDLKTRLANRIQLTTDGFKPYLSAVEEAFGANVDFAQLVKEYGKDERVVEAKRKYAPPEITGVHLDTVTGNPDIDKISTSDVERHNLTMRMQLKRLGRLTIAFSKKLDNLVSMLAIYLVHYNFMRIHGNLKTTPAIKAGIQSKVLDWSEILATQN